MQKLGVASNQKDLSEKQVCTGSSIRLKVETMGGSSIGLSVCLVRKFWEFVYGSTFVFIW